LIFTSRQPTLSSLFVAAVYLTIIKCATFTCEQKKYLLIGAVLLWILINIGRIQGMPALYKAAKIKLPAKEQ